MEPLVETAIAFIIGIATGLIFEPAIMWLSRSVRRKVGYVRTIFPSDYPARIGLIFAAASVIRACLTGADRWDDAYALFTFSMGALIGCHLLECWRSVSKR